MLRKSTVLALLFVFAASSALMAGEGKEDMMKAMMDCSVCSKMMPHLTWLGPVMQAEVVDLNNGVAVIHNITDKDKVAKFHAVSEEMQAAGKACMDYTDAEAKEELCNHCADMRSAIKAGANFSVGLTEHGDMMVLTSDDPKLQKKIDALQKNFEMMVASH